MRRTLLTLALAMLIAGIPAGAHHSFATYYFENQSITIEGDVQEFQFRSPHAILLFAARGPEGQMHTYAAEWGNPRRLGGQGIDKDTLKTGDRVVVTGSPGRNASDYKVHLKGIQRPTDGWSWSGGGRR